MSGDYLWDKSGAPDPDVERLERQLGTFKYHEPLRAAADAPPANDNRVYVALAAAAVVLIGLGWLGWSVLGGSGAAPTVAEQAAPDAAGPALAHACTAETDMPSWGVTVVTGAPSCGTGESDRLPVGGWLETDARSSAEIEVADIGRVIVAPASRVRLASTGADEHRMELAVGKIQASVTAPPRLFVVDTPSATAVDLGCEYTLEVDDSGASHLHVTAGFVSMERGEVGAYVPEGFMVDARADGRIGVPYADDASVDLRRALEAFVFGARAESDLDALLSAARPRDRLTLEQLGERLEGPRRQKVAARLDVLDAPTWSPNP